MPLRLRLPSPIQRAFELAERERKFILSELVQVKGLMPVLMKRRNKQQWTPEDIAEIRTHLQRALEAFPVPRDPRDAGRLCGAADSRLVAGPPAQPAHRQRNDLRS